MKEESARVLDSVETGDNEAVGQLVKEYQAKKNQIIKEEDQKIEGHYKSIMMKAQKELEKQQAKNDLSDEKIGEIAEKIIAETDEKDEKELLSKAEKQKSLAEKDEDDEEGNVLLGGKNQINLVSNTSEIIKRAKEAQQISDRRKVHPVLAQT